MSLGWDMESVIPGDSEGSHSDRFADSIADWLPFDGLVAPVLMVGGPPRERHAATSGKRRHSHMRCLGLASIMNE